MTRCCVLLAEGFEEIEAVTVLDVLRRAGVETVSLGLDALAVAGAHGVTVMADALLADGIGQDWDLVVLPGGMPGAATLRDDSRVQDLIRKQHDGGGKLAAICAAPIALGKAGLLAGKAATSYPGFGDQLDGAQLSEERVVIDADGRITTSRGPGTSLEFALSLVAQLVDEDAAQSLSDAMLVASS